jgi:hypothetical protein
MDLLPFGSFIRDIAVAGLVPRGFPGLIGSPRLSNVARISCASVLSIHSASHNSSNIASSEISSVPAAENGSDLEPHAENGSDLERVAEMNDRILEHEWLDSPDIGRSFIRSTVSVVLAVLGISDSNDKSGGKSEKSTTSTHSTFPNNSSNVPSRRDSWICCIR